MGVLARFGKVLVQSHLRPRLQPLEPSVLQFRVWPTDLDMNRHMTNSRYLELMDLGRTDQMVRMGLGRLIVRERWMPVVASTTLRFRRSLLPWQRFELQTRMLCWDDKWFFIEQRFVRDGRTVTIALAKCVVRRSGGWVSPPEFLQRLYGEPITSPEMPESVRAWVRSEGLLRGEDLQVVSAA